MVEAVLIIESTDRKYLDSIYRSLEPDNVNPPRSIGLSSSVINNKYIFKIKTMLQGKSFDSLRGTLDEVLSLIEAIDNALTMLK